MKKVLSVALALGFVVLTASCDSLLDPLHNHPGCTANSGPLWNSNVSFLISHTDARSCPLGAEYGSMQSTGSIVRDQTANYATNTYKAFQLSLKVSDYAGSFSEVFDSCEPPLLANVVYQNFYWTPAPPPPNQNNRNWEAQLYQNYTVGDSPDFACFGALLTNSAYPARARINIAYYGTQFREGSSKPKAGTP